MEQNKRKIGLEEEIEMIVRHSYTDYLRELSNIEKGGYRDRLSDFEISLKKDELKYVLAKEVTKEIVKLLSEKEE